MLQTILSTASTPSTAYQEYCLAIVIKNRCVRVIARRDALGNAVTEFSPSVFANLVPVESFDNASTSVCDLFAGL